MFAKTPPKKKNTTENSVTMSRKTNTMKIPCLMLRLRQDELIFLSNSTHSHQKPWQRHEAVAIPQPPNREVRYMRFILLFQ